MIPQTPKYPIGQKVYKHGLPFSEKLRYTLDSAYDRVYKDNKATVIIMDGQMGSGKTSLAVNVGDYFNFKSGFPLIKLDPKDHPQLAMGGKEFIDKLVLCYKKKLPVLIYDESGDYTGKGAMTRFNRMLNRIFETMRAFKVIVILCLPSVKVLDKHLMLQGVARFLIHIDRPKNTQAEYIIFDLDRMFWVIFHSQKLINPLMAYKRVYPNQYGHCLPLEGDIGKLEPIRGSRAYYLKIISDKSKEKSATHASVKLDGLLSYHDIAIKIGRSQNWIRNVVSKKNIKESKIVKNTKYFNPNIMERLYNYMDEVKK